MMLNELKEVLNSPIISGLAPSLLAFILGGYVRFRKRDFFSRPLLEQAETVKWLRSISTAPTDILDRAELQLRLQAAGLHRDRGFSQKLIAFRACHPDSCLPSLKSVLRWYGLYTVHNEAIKIQTPVKWVLPLMMIYIVVYMGSSVRTSYLQHNETMFATELACTIIAIMVWGFMVSRAVQVSRFSKMFNTFTPPAETSRRNNENFSSILNAPYTHN
jgi:hypothetical protein